MLFDDNGISIDGPTSLAVSDDQIMRFSAYGWHTDAVDGHDPAAIERAIAAARAETGRPSLIACRTVIGKGAPTKAGKASAHGAPLGASEIEGARAALGWPHPPFEVPEEILAAWRAAGARGRRAPTRPGSSGHEAAPAELRAALRRRHRRRAAGRARRRPSTPTSASCRPSGRPGPRRKASQMALEVLTAAVPAMVGGSADLTHSNLTNTAATTPITPGDYGGRYVSYGVREHAMVAAMNGMAVHGGIIPYGGTFLVFADYCRPALRLAALMRQRVIFVATHDSIGLGEDGPTHQPVEHLASLRAIPNMLVFRPADAVETAECWELALRQAEGPSVLALTRQELPTLRTRAHGREPVRARRLPPGRRRRAARRHHPRHRLGGASGAGGRASGSAARAIAAAVVSMPSWELFERQDPAYRAAVLGSAPRVAVEAASPFGWTRYVASEADVVGMTRLRRQRARQGSCTSISASRPSTWRRRRARSWTGCGQPGE